MKLNILLSELLAQYSFIDSVIAVKPPSLIIDKIIEKEKNKIYTKNNDINLFLNYYKNIILKCESIYNNKCNNEVEYIFFIMQNFMSHAIPNRFGYLKIGKMNDIDCVAPYIDISNRVIYSITNNVNYDLKLIEKTSNVTSYTNTKNFVIQINSNFTKRIKHSIGVLSILIEENIEDSINLINNLSSNLCSYCDVIAVGSKESIQIIRDYFVQKFKVKVETIFDFSNYSSVSVKYNSLAYFMLEKI